MKANQPPVVRRRASQRKGRIEEVVHRARRPAQKRSAERFDAILRAAETLLETADIEDISFHDIARQAGLPPPSVHYLFPTISSVRIELFRIYNQRNAELLAREQQRIAGALLPWPDRVAHLSGVLRDAFNASRPMLEIVLGPALHREARLAAIETNNEVAKDSLAALHDAYILPEIPGLLEMIQLNGDITDALWSRSYICENRITDEILDRSIQIQINNLRSLLPNILIPRSSVGTILADSEEQ